MIGAGGSGTVSLWMSGARFPRRKTLQAIASAMHVSERWLLTGEGERSATPSPRRVAVLDMADPWAVVQAAARLLNEGPPGPRGALLGVVDEWRRLPSQEAEQRRGDGESPLHLPPERPPRRPRTP